MILYFKHQVSIDFIKQGSSILEKSNEIKKRRHSIKIRLILLFVLVSLIPVAITTFTNMKINIDQATKRLNQNSSNALDESINIIIEYNRQAAYLSNFLANSQEIQSHLHSDQLGAILENIKNFWFMGILEIFNTDSDLITRSFAPQNGIEWFFTPPPTPMVQRALQMEFPIDYVLGQGGMAIKASAPIIDPKTAQVIGAVVVTFPLNHMLLNQIKERIDSDVTIQWNSAGSIASTFETNEGQPLGLIWNSAVKEFGKIENQYIQKIEMVGNERFIITYSALKNSKSKTIGIISTAKNYDPVEQFKKNALNTIFINSIIALAIAILLGFLTATYFTKPIYLLVDTIRRISEGDLHRQVDINRSDEIGELANTFNTMTNQLAQNQTALEDAEKKYRGIFENAVEGIFQYASDGHLLSVNDSMATILGYESPEHILSSISDISLQLFASTDAWNRFETELASVGKVIDFEAQMYRKDGVRIWVSLSARTSYDENNHVAIFDGFLVDITKRRKAEKKLKAFAQKLSLHIEQTPLGVIEWDLDFRVTQWNSAAEKIFGYSKKEAMGRTGLELVVPKEVHKLVQPIWEDLVNGIGGTQSTNENRTKEGNLIICDWYNTSLLDITGNVIGVASLVQNVTKQKTFEKDKALLEKQLQQSQKMEAIGTLAGGVAHDFNNILSIILGYSEMLLTDLALDPSSESKLGQIIKAGDRAKDLVSQILAFSRQNTEEYLPIQPDLIIKEALKMLRSSIPTTIKIEKNVPKCGSIIGNPTQLHQIIMNLCTNAYHAMRESGGLLKVTLGSVILAKTDTKFLSLASPPGPYIKLEISDNGHGMNKTTQQKIFDPYFTTKKTGDGTGLGLSVVHGIVTNFGGQISVYSEPNKGTTFRIFIPQSTIESDVTLKNSIETHPTGDEHILVVDDEKPITEMEKFMLENLGYKVSTFTSSIEALRKYQNQPNDIDLLITDMTMPNMTGAELIQSVRMINPNLPVILCSGFSDLMDEKKANQIERLVFLKKPILKKDFAKAVRDLLDIGK